MPTAHSFFFRLIRELCDMINLRFWVVATTVQKSPLSAVCLQAARVAYGLRDYYESRGHFYRIPQPHTAAAESFECAAVFLKRRRAAPRDIVA